MEANREGEEQRKMYVSAPVSSMRELPYVH